MSKDARLVYSTDPALNQKCPKCKELVSECTCEAEVDVKSHRFVAVLRIEKQARGGKTGGDFSFTLTITFTEAGGGSRGASAPDPLLRKTNDGVISRPAR